TQGLRTVTGTNGKPITVTARIKLLERENAQLKVQLLGKHQVGKVELTGLPSKTNAHAVILGDHAAAKVAVNSGILGGTKANVGILTDQDIAMISLIIGSNGNGGGGGGGGGGGDGGGAGGGGVGGGLSSLDGADQQALRIKCKNVIGNAK